MVTRMSSKLRMSSPADALPGACLLAALAIVSISLPALAQAPSAPSASAARVSNAPPAASSPAPAATLSVPPSATQSAAPQVPVIPAVHHAPVSTALAHQDLRIRADIDNPHLVRRAWVAWRSANSPAIKTQPFQRASDGPYLAVLPGSQIEDPWLEYCIELETVDGRTLPAFASRDAMFRVEVPEDLEDMRERALAQRLGERRSVAFASGEFVYFGDTDAMVAETAGGPVHPEGIADRYWRSEAGYTYRPLGVVSEFSIRAGVVRGQSVVPHETDKAKYQVGLNYASPKVRFRAADSFFLDAELLTSVTEVGFSMGGGGALLMGDPYGTHMTFGFESIETFGTRFYSRMDISATDTVQIAPIIEVTDMPHADRYGVRLLTEVQFDAGAGFQLGVRGGYQARTYTSGGPSVGTTISYAF